MKYFKHAEELKKHVRVLDFQVPAAHTEQILTFKHIYFRPLFFRHIQVTTLLSSPFLLSSSPGVITVLKLSSVLPTWVFCPPKRCK